MWLMWFPLHALRYPASLLIFNYFDGSSQTLPFSIRKYISFRSCRVAILLFFNKYSLSVLQCNFYKVCFYQVVCVFSFSFFIILFFFCFQRSQFQLGVSESIGYIFNKQDPLFYKRFISRASNISMITSACSSADGKKKKDAAISEADTSMKLGLQHYRNNRPFVVRKFSEEHLLHLKSTSNVKIVQVFLSSLYSWVNVWVASRGWWRQRIKRKLLFQISGCYVWTAHWCRDKQRSWPLRVFFSVHNWTVLPPFKPGPLVSPTKHQPVLVWLKMGASFCNECVNGWKLYSCLEDRKVVNRCISICHRPLTRVATHPVHGVYC